MQVNINVNGTEVKSAIEARLLLVHFVREVAQQTGTHWGCDTSNCGACVVWLDDVPVIWVNWGVRKDILNISQMRIQRIAAKNTTSTASSRWLKISSGATAACNQAVN